MSDAEVFDTSCPYCGVGCGVSVTRTADSELSLRGNVSHPANAGRLCSKGSALLDTLGEENRLLYPSINDQRVSWNEATDHIASKLNDTIQRYGHDSIAFYVSGQLLTEDYYVVNKLTKGWLGTANIDTNSRLCMASSVVGHKRAFGSDTVPGCYEDLEQADSIVLVGSNLAWCHPVLHQRIMAEKKKRPSLFLIVIDPRRTATADAADLHLPIQPDADTALFNGLLRYLVHNEKVNQSFVHEHVAGFNDSVSAAEPWDLAEVAVATGLPLQTIQAFYKRVADCEKLVSLYSQGANQSISGTDKVNAIINVHLATGRIGKSGMGPFSITGQPNAMGGREVGGLATMLAAHMDIANSDHQDRVQRFWQSPRIATETGLCAVDLFKAVGDGRIKAVWIMGTNPVDSLPDADSVKSALNACPLVIVSEVCNDTDTLECAHVKLPAHAWGEKDGTVTNSERCISRQRALKPSAGESRANWQTLCDVARKMGWVDGFEYQKPAEIFREHAALSAFENSGDRDFNIGRCTTLTDAEYKNLSPFYWPCAEGELPRSPVRFFKAGNFFTPDKRANMISISAAQSGNAALSDQYPLILNTGRIRDQWHTMTRTGYSARLSQHLAEPYLQINPQDALIHGLTDADIVRLQSPYGDVLLRTMLSERQLPGQVFAPMHWTDQFSGKARIDTLIAPRTDPNSRQPASKNQVVRMQRFNANSFALVLTRHRPALQAVHSIDYWAASPVANGWRTELASTLSVEELMHVMTPLLTQVNDVDTLNFTDGAKGLCHYAEFCGDTLQTLVYIAEGPVEASRSWVVEQLDSHWSATAKRWQLLAGRAGADQPDKGAIVCSCFKVGMSEIEAAVEKGCSTVDAVGKALQAGTNCGSCRSEIQAVLTRSTQTLKRKCTTSPSRIM